MTKEQRPMRKFPLIPQCAYYTPFRAVVPLIPFIKHVEHYTEPCAGPRLLVRHLAYFGIRCGYASDLDDGVDALTDPQLLSAKTIITNPPYEWSVLSKLLTRFLSICETWLLLELDFQANARCAPFMRKCSDIVPCGKIKWFADTKHSSNKNYAWYRFDPAHDDYPKVHPRTLVPRGIQTSEDHAAWMAERAKVEA